MSIRFIIISILVLIGIAFLVPSNPYTDKITKPITKTLNNAYSYFDSKIDIPKIIIPSETTTVHKWQDENGEWHFTNEAPPKNINSESKVYKNDDNVVPVLIDANNWSILSKYAQKTSVFRRLLLSRRYRL